jgi:hypothetical protein
VPMLFSPTIEAAITAGYWFLRARCPACRTTGDVDLRTLDWHRGAAVTALTPSLSCRSCRPNAPFAELVCLSRLSVTDEWNVERGRAALGEEPAPLYLVGRSPLGVVVIGLKGNGVTCARTSPQPSILPCRTPPVVGSETLQTMLMALPHTY